MATNTVDDDVNRSATGESKQSDLRNDNDPSSETDLSSEIDSLRERLMRALAETENTRRQGERREQDAQQYAIAKFAVSCCRLSTICVVPSTRVRPMQRRERAPPA